MDVNCLFMFYHDLSKQIFNSFPPMLLISRRRQWNKLNSESQSKDRGGGGNGRAACVQVAAVVSI